MSRHFRWILVACFAALATVALAIYPKLSNTFVGLPYNGATPSGEIRVDQSKLNSAPAKVMVRMQGVNVPDGTEVLLEIGGEYYGSLPVFGRKVDGTILTYLQTGRGATAYVRVPDGTVIAYVAQAWKT